MSTICICAGIRATSLCRRAAILSAASVLCSSETSQILSWFLSMQRAISTGKFVSTKTRNQLISEKLSDDRSTALKFLARKYPPGFECLDLCGCAYA